MKALDLTGEKFGKVTVVSRNGHKSNKIAWLCRCDCGKEFIALTCNLRQGYTNSCGCSHKEAAKLNGRKGIYEGEVLAKVIANDELRKLGKQYCTRCHSEKPLEDFHNNRPICKRCFAFRDIARKYGLTQQAFEALLIKQDAKCAICKDAFTFESRETSPYIDHCHNTGNVRGLLCTRCNMGIGLLRDNPDYLIAASIYLGGKAVCN